MMGNFDKALDTINEIESNTIEQRIMEKIQKDKKCKEAVKKSKRSDVLILESSMPDLCITNHKQSQSISYVMEQLEPLQFESKPKKSKALKHALKTRTHPFNPDLQSLISIKKIE